MNSPTIWGYLQRVHFIPAGPVFHMGPPNSPDPTTCLRISFAVATDNFSIPRKFGIFKKKVRYNKYSDYNIYLKHVDYPRVLGEIQIQRGSIPGNLPDAGAPKLRLLSTDSRFDTEFADRQTINSIFEGLHVGPERHLLIVTACFTSMEFANCPTGTYRVMYNGNMLGCSGHEELEKITLHP